MSAASVLAGVLKAKGDLPDAEALYREVLQARRQKGMRGQAGADTAAAMNALASLLKAKGGNDREVEDIYCEVLDLRRSTLGHRHPKTLTSMTNLGWHLYTRNGDLRSAEPLYQEALEVRRETQGAQQIVVDDSRARSDAREPGAAAATAGGARGALHARPAQVKWRLIVQRGRSGRSTGWLRTSMSGGVS